MDAAAAFLKFLREVPAGILHPHMQTASPEVRDQRLAICRGCDNHRDGRCLSVIVEGKVKEGCGCELKMKTLNPVPTCPQNKWPA